MNPCPICSDWKFAQLIDICPMCGQPGGRSELIRLAQEFLEGLEDDHASQISHIQRPASC